jgi:low temperature requirement protein LtrA
MSTITKHGGWMANTAETIRTLWQRPQLRERQKERSATWLELFYDLVFVVAVAQLGQLLSHDLTTTGLFKFIGLFIPVWYAWFHHTLYSDRFDTDNFAHRFLTIVLMIGVAGIAANVHGAFGETSQAFAASFVLVKLVMTIFYRRCTHIEVARPLANRLSNVFVISSALWLVSIFVPIEWRFWIWGAAVAFEYAVVFHRSTRMKYAVMPLTESHVVERWGLFTIIVLGETVAGIVGGAVELENQLDTAVIAVFGLLMIFGYWWIYFENTDGSALKGIGGWYTVIWLYVHLPLTISLTSLGIGIEHMIAEGLGHSPQPSVIWLMSGSLAVSYITIGITHLVISKFKPETLNPLKARWRFGAAALVILIGILVNNVGGSALLLLVLLSLVSLGQVLGELFVLDESSEEMRETPEELELSETT